MISTLRRMVKRVSDSIVNYFRSSQDRLAEIENRVRGLKDSLAPSLGGKILDYTTIVFSGTIGGVASGLGLTALGVANAFYVVPAVLIAGAVSGLGGKKFRDSSKRSHNNKIVQQIKAQRLAHIYSQLELFSDTRQGTQIEFNLNPEAFNIPEIEFLEITPAIFSNMLGIFNKKKNANEKPILVSINLSNTKLSDTQLQDLLAAGLGVFGTQSLNLGNNSLTFEGIRALEKAIVDRKFAFQSLKVLDLQGNKLTGDCLERIANIVNHLEIEELNLSNNNFDQGNLIYGAQQSRYSSNMEKFILDLPTTMPSLKRLHLSQCGLGVEPNAANNTRLGGGRQVKALKEMLTRVSLLSYLDLSNNSGIRFKHLEETILSKGLSVNHSVKQIVVDLIKQLNISERFSLKSNALSSINCIGSETESRAILLLNYRLNNEFPANVLEYMPNKSDDRFLEIIEYIEHYRANILGIDKSLKIKISEKELIKQMKRQLGPFYKEILNNQHHELVEPELILNIRKEPEKNSQLTPDMELPATVGADTSHSTPTPQVQIHRPIVPNFRSMRETSRNLDSSANQPANRAKPGVLKA